MARERNVPVLITDAPEDPERELRRREIRYVAMMLTRAACIVGAAVFASTKPPLWGLWVALSLVSALLLPWFAVLLANDRPAKTRAERHHPPHPPTHSQPALPALPAPRPQRTIDGDL